MIAAAVIPQICVFCGVNPATTRDHVPPQGLFPPPRPENLITVPSCVTCNRGTSVTDERFRGMLALYVHPEGETAVRLWEVARRGFHHNQRLRREVVASFRPIEIETPEGIIIGEGTGFEWDRASHDATIQKFTRGLYWHHYGEMLPPDTPIEVTLVHEFPQHLLEMLGQQPVHMIGDQQFVYKFRRVDDDPSVSVWLQAFYGRHLTYVTTGDLPQ